MQKQEQMDAFSSFLRPPLSGPLLASWLESHRVWTHGKKRSLRSGQMPHRVEQQVSKCGPQTSIISITWNLIKNANSWDHLTDESETL